VEDGGTPYSIFIPIWTSTPSPGQDERALEQGRSGPPAKRAIERVEADSVDEASPAYPSNPAMSAAEWAMRPAVNSRQEHEPVDREHDDQARRRCPPPRQDGEILALRRGSNGRSLGRGP
jgi:hypothetical protein